MILAAAAALAVSASEPAWPLHYQRASGEMEAGRMQSALKWFYVGQLRGRIHTNCVEQDPTGGPALLGALQEVMGGPLNLWAGGKPDVWTATIDEALAWDAANPDPDVTTDRCRAEQVTQRAGLADLRAQIDKSRSEIAAERKKNGL